MALQSLSPGEAILQITGKTGRFRFLAPAELVGLYSHTNEYEPQAVVQSGNLYVDESPTLLWHGGKDDPVSLELTMVAGASLDIDTPGILMDYTNRLLALGQWRKSTGTQRAPEVIRLQIGSWFARKALVLSVGAGFKRPYDPGTGLPYVATVTFSLQYVYDTIPTVNDFTLDRG
jgi:hypothetical protein